MISFLQLCKDEGLTTLFHDDRMVDQIIDSLSTLKHLLGMNVVASHHCVPSWWRDPLQPWSLPPSSPCISPADWLEGQEAQVMWSDGPITVHIALPSHLSGVQSKDIRFAGCCKKKGHCITSLLLSAFYFLIFCLLLFCISKHFWYLFSILTVSA